MGEKVVYLVDLGIVFVVSELEILVGSVETILPSAWLVLHLELQVHLLVVA